MPQKPTTRKDQGKAKARGRSEGEAEKAQGERFIATAREIGVDETGAEFEVALGKIAPARKGKPPEK